MSSSQRRIGPYNIGLYGIFSSFINGCNLILCQFIILKVQFNYGFQLFPTLFIIYSLGCYNIVYPFFLIDITLSLILLFLFSTLSIVLLILSAFSGCSKYSLLGCIRLTGQLISFELIWTTLLLIIIWSYDDFSIINYWLYCIIDHLIISSSLCITLYSLLYYIIIYIIFFISILADCNRTPSDLPEAESELVAGFITEYSSIYFSIILLTEYGNIIVFIWFLMILFSITAFYFIFYLFIVCLIRSSFLRLKYDELMITAWIIILPFIFSILFILFIAASVYSFIYPFLTITSILIDQSLDLLVVFSSGTLFYLCDHSSSYCFLIFNSIIYFSFIFLLTYLLVCILFCYQLSSLLIIPKSIIGSSCSFFIPIYQDLLLILSCHFFRAQINLIEVIIGFECNYSLYHVHLFSSIQLINFILLSLVIAFSILWAYRWIIFLTAIVFFNTTKILDLLIITELIIYALLLIIY